MTKTQKKTNIQRTAQALFLLAVVGIISSFAFVFVAVASGIVPSDVIVLANDARTEAGLTVLTENARLSEAARSKAEDMLKNDYFAHTSPQGIEPWYWIKQAGYQYQAAGENLAINYTDATEQHQAWMNSELHRSNIMNAHYRDIGVAVARGRIHDKESIVTVEYFGVPLYTAADVKGAETAATPSPAILAARLSGLEEVVFAWLVLSVVLMPGIFVWQALRLVWRRERMNAQGSVPLTVPLG